MPPSTSVAHKLQLSKTHMKAFAVILLFAIVAGVGTGYMLAGKNSKSAGATPEIQEAAKQAQQDTKTFRDFAEGKITKKPDPKPGEEYTEGTHLLVRQGSAPVALTSSVVDLSKYEGKNVKVLGETQKALQEGWLMDVGKVEEK